VIHEILISVIADDANSAHEAVTQMAESRGSEVLEVLEELISQADEDVIDGFCVQARLTAGTTT
jgi:hypothetical protein